MKLSKKLVAVLSAGVMAFALFGMAGCSSSESAANVEKTTEEINAQDLNVTGSGFTVLPDQTVSYAFTVENPNEGYVANSVTFTIEGYDANDVMLIGGGETIQEVYPGVTTAAAGTSYLSDASAEIVRFEIKPLMQNVLWTKTTDTPDQLNSMFQLSDTQVTESDGAMTITGTISADLGDTEGSAESSLDSRKDAHVVAILRDADGNILCGGTAMGIMLDPSMTPINTTVPSSGVVPDTVDEEGNPVEPNDAELVSGEPTEEQAQDAAAQDAQLAEEQTSNVASTTFTITIPGIVDYATVDVYATPGI